ncbi:hypothetical protein [Acanthopleuribacter pedis]|uniref:Uncharacterized protein n=1 Tax=Acanthopleuribacter pedis TaxID=442870 RepID=A0A8J7Q608_9BACT|nr:hypothetical protein [Acanthopleuribacter pedis]MBO1321127.1 hypothetical protein [Acanthopleuribacter pedis]
MENSSNLVLETGILHLIRVPALIGLLADKKTRATPERWKKMGIPLLDALRCVFLGGYPFVVNGYVFLGVKFVCSG